MSLREVVTARSTVPRPRAPPSLPIPQVKPERLLCPLAENHTQLGCQATWATRGHQTHTQGAGRSGTKVAANTTGGEPNIPRGAAGHRGHLAAVSLEPNQTHAPGYTPRKRGPCRCGSWGPALGGTSRRACCGAHCAADGPRGTRRQAARSFLIGNVLRRSRQ